MGRRKKPLHERLLQQAVESRRLSWPLPTKYDRLDDATVCAYIEHAAAIFLEVKSEAPLAASIYAGQMYEHVKARHAKMWDAALAAYHAAPANRARTFVAQWLMRFSGQNQQRIETIVDLIVSGDVQYFSFGLAQVLSKFNQEQWDKVVPLFTEFQMQENLRYNVDKCSAELQERGVCIWYPRTHNSMYDGKPEVVEEKVAQYVRGEEPADSVADFLMGAILHLRQEQWDQLVPLIRYRSDKKDLLKMVELWQEEIDARGLKPWVP